MSGRFVAVAGITLVLAVALVGCGGGGDDSAGETQTDTGSAATVIDEADQAQAEGIVLGLDDFPTGWRAEMPEDDDEGIEDCTTFDFSDMTLTGRAESDEFTSGSVSTVSSLAVVFENDADTAFDQLASEATANCLRDFIEERVKEDPAPEGVTFGEISVGEISFPTLGEASRAYEVVIEVKAEGLSPNVFADLIFINKGRSVALLYFVDAFSPFDNDMKVELSEKVAARMDLGG